MYRLGKPLPKIESKIKEIWQPKKDKKIYCNENMYYNKNFYKNFYKNNNLKWINNLRKN